MLKILYCGGDRDWPAYRGALPEAIQSLGLSADVSRDHDARSVDYLVFSPAGQIRDFAPFTKARAVLSLWAGVEQIVGNPTLTQPLARMVDPGLTRGMTEWVLGHVLRHHLGIDRHLAAQATRVWDEVTVPPLASERTVGILGLGELGGAAAEALTMIGFPVVGWSRSAKSLPGVTTYSGLDGLSDTLKASQILVLLLPQTPGTQNVLNSETLALLPKGAVILNPGRGPLVDDNALLEALDSGHVAHATLDVFREEPLPHDHPYWGHPKVTVTPHIASVTRVKTASVAIAQNIARVERGEPLLNKVDRELGY